MNRFYIILFLFLFQTCSPNSDKDSLLVLFLKGDNHLPHVNESITSLDEKNPAGIQENSIRMPWEWTLTSGNSSTKSIKRPKVVIDLDYIYVVADYDTTHVDKQSNKILVTNSLILKKYDPDKNLIWTKMIGVPGTVLRVIAMKGNDEQLYITGTTNGFFESKRISEYEDTFVAAVDKKSGNLLWKKQIGNAENYSFTPTAILSDNASLFIAGTTNKNLNKEFDPETPFISKQSLFLMKINTKDKNRVWLKQTSIAQADIMPTDLALDIFSDNSEKNQPPITRKHIYLLGTAKDADVDREKNTLGPENQNVYSLFILKYDANNGTEHFVSQLGGKSPQFYTGNSIAVERRYHPRRLNLYVVGNSNVNNSTQEVKKGYYGILANFNITDNGIINSVMVTNFGSAQLGKITNIRAINIDHTRQAVYIAGETNEDLIDKNTRPTGEKEIFVSKISTEKIGLQNLNHQKNWIWLHQFGSLNSMIFNPTIDSNFQNLYLCGSGSGSLNQIPFQGELDQFLIKFDLFR